MDGVFSKLKSLDAFPKVNDDFYQRTLSGGVITIISSIMMIALFFSELSAAQAHRPPPCARPAAIQGAAINNPPGRLCHGVRCGPGLFMTVTKTNELSVDTSRGELLQINVRGRPGPQRRVFPCVLAWQAAACLRDACAVRCCGSLGCARRI